MVTRGCQTQILSEVDKTHLTQTKCDQSDADNPDDSAHLQRWYVYHSAILGYVKFCYVQ